MIKRIVLAMALVIGGLLFSHAATASCVGHFPYRCVTATFKKELHNNSPLKNTVITTPQCEGIIAFSYEGQDIESKVIFDDRSECPKKGTKLQGDVESLCQDEGRYTPADWTFTEMKCVLD
ncbi:MAG: hypothetical protein SFW62_04655 [Alphaproteobacteria bacterium]|nr:hypothetical protein [Alphaproteobacteria bacterium]